MYKTVEKFLRPGALTVELVVYASHKNFSLFRECPRCRARLIIQSLDVKS